MSENGEIYTAGKNFTLPPAVTGLTISTSDYRLSLSCQKIHQVRIVKSLEWPQSLKISRRIFRSPENKLEALTSSENLKAEEIVKL